MCGARGMRSSGVERPACPSEHRSLLVEIDEARKKGLANEDRSDKIFCKLLYVKKKRLVGEHVYRLYSFCFFSVWRSRPNWISRSISSGYGIPVAAHILGYMLIEVKPGRC